MKLDDLFYFFSAAKAHSTSIAAEQLHVSQPTISQAIKRLEQELGINLFKRTYRGVTLTPAGEELYDIVPNILNAIEDIKILSTKYQQCDLTNCTPTQPTIINVNTLNILASSFPDGVISAACKKEILIQLRTPFEQINNLNMALPFAENDMALFFSNSINFNITDIPENYTAEIIATSKLYFVVNKEHPDFRDLSTVSYSDILKTPLIAPYDTNSIKNHTAAIVFEQLLNHGNPTIVMHCEKISKIQHIVANTNYGTIFFKSFNTSVSKNTNLKYIPINDNRKFLIVALYRKDHPKLSDIRFILSQLKKYV